MEGVLRVISTRAAGVVHGCDPRHVGRALWVLDRLTMVASSGHVMSVGLSLLESALALAAGLVVAHGFYCVYVEPARARSRAVAPHDATTAHG